MTAETAELAPKPRRRRFRRALGVFAIFLLLLVVVRVWWGWESKRQMHAAIERYRAAGEPILLEDFIGPPLDDSENAARLLNDAAAGLVETNDDGPTVSDLCVDPAVCAAYAERVAGIVRDNAQTLDLLHQAAQLDRAQWRQSMQPPIISILLPQLSPQRSLAKLSSVAAIHHHQTGDDAQAVRALLDMLANAEHAADGEPFLISYLVRVAIEGLAIQTLEDVLPTLHVAGDQPAPPGTTPADREDLARLMERLLDDETSTEAWLFAMHGERLMQLDAGEMLSSGQASPATFGGGPANAGTWLGALVLGPAWRLDTIRCIDRTSAWAAAGTLPNYPTAQAQAPAAPAYTSKVEAIVRFPSAVVMPALDGGLQARFHHVAHRRMAAIAVALRLYELDHGKRPETLSTLAPQYLPDIPLDPFRADEAPLGYAPDADPPVLYSVSINGTDEGGAFGLSRPGNVDWRAKDLPLFLNGERPRSNDGWLKEETPAASSEAEPDAAQEQQPERYERGSD